MVKVEKIKKDMQGSWIVWVGCLLAFVIVIFVLTFSVLYLFGAFISTYLIKDELRKNPTGYLISNIQA